ncbi:helix-turn-helix protein [Saccharopolyspora erythraea NRRL 2338]|uniref:Transcriptional regulator, XRE family n=3 Tax=Saccharopolyspora erythraea TaxID=1836 RepID=A4FFW2_SACEN|nr:helix-turn-helix protein [Saccharopolyspora erythraea NRRL 2338]CAM02937.1 transcriptional regulator, XRE family [Saccharopolyspora erythraea NRRL 2338]
MAASTHRGSTMSEPDPTVRGQELGEELRGLREASGLSLADVAKRIDASASKLSRLETGRRAIAVEDVAALLAIYGVNGTQRRELLALAREAQRRGWWQRDRPGFAERQRTLVSLEAKADRIVNFEGMVIPGLLQTGEYTRALLAARGELGDEEIERRMVVRLRRHAVLRGEFAPRLLAVVDELALHRIVGGRDVLRRQLEHLVESTLRPNISVRVVPNIGTPAASAKAFQILERAGAPTVVFLENLGSSLFLEERHEIEMYGSLLRGLLAVALDEPESVKFIAELARRLGREASTA